MKYLYSLLMVAASLAFVACSNDDEEGGNAQVPNGALPTEEFTLGNLDDEPYADDAIKIESEDVKEAPFASLELFGDGHYLLLSNNDYNYSQTNSSVKRLKVKARTTRAVEYYDGYEYGEFTKDGNVYTLGNGQQVDLSNIDSRTVRYTSADGNTAAFTVNKKEADDAIGTNSLCRSWAMQSIEEWAYLNKAYIAHIKWWNENGEWKNAVKTTMDYEGDDLLEADDVAYRVVFSKNGTYLCFYVDGEVDLSTWHWQFRNEGILHYEWPDEPEANGDVTVRFKGKQMRIYEDNSQSESGMTLRCVMVSTLTAE